MSPDTTDPSDEPDLSGLGRAFFVPETRAPSTPWVPPSAEELAAILPDYEIVRMLGAGGMGAVYLGRQSSLNRPVAIKILSSALDAADPSFAERFKNEARAMGKLSHPAIVKVHDFGEKAEGLLYLVMEYVDGSDAARLIAASGRLRTEEAVTIARRVCDALAYAHDRGIIHRDIKPANILVGNDGSVKVADFGLAKVCAEGQTLGLTMSGTTMGTMHFMAPESLQFGETVDPRADLYSLGVTLYQMLTGKLPKGLFELPSLLVPGLDPRLDGVVARCLQEDRELRYQKARDLRSDLDSIRTRPLPQEEEIPTLPDHARRKPPKAKVAKPPSDPTAAGMPQSASQWILWSVFGGGLLLTMIAVLALGPILLGVLVTMDREPKTSRPATPSTPPPDDPGKGGSVSAPHPEPPGPNSLDSARSFDLQSATRENPFVNTLGMTFVPVPGTKVLMCIHETRRIDYAAFASVASGIDSSWDNPAFQDFGVGTRGGDDPVVSVSWVEAKAFCTWMRVREGHPYRLPRDREWSAAVGIASIEPEGRTPELLKNGVADQWPWGGQFPPPAPLANLADESLARIFPSYPHVSGYKDGFSLLAPVMSFPSNPLGIYDLGGNVWEWCEDRYGGDLQPEHVLRGGGFLASSSSWTLSSHRTGRDGQTHRDVSTGFRCVVEISESP